MGLDTIYDAAKISRREYRNRAMFLFQSFEPSAAGPAADEMQWVVMEGAEVRKYRPYALVVEISRTISGHLVKIMYDENVFTKPDTERIAVEQVEQVEEMMAADPNVLVGDFLRKAQ